MRARRLATIATAALMMIGLGAPGASAAEAPDTTAPVSGMVDGQKYGPADGYEVTTESYPVVPGEKPMEFVFGDTPPADGVSPMATWGTSYATSTETAYLFFTGRAKAAANVYNNQRIVKVCISYSNPGRSSPTVCSSATSNGAKWTAGGEKTVGFTDNLSDNWPKTVFNISTTRINPNVY